MDEVGAWNEDVEFFAEYGVKDAALYALAIGFGSTALDYKKDLRFLYEDHAKFTVAPTLSLTLTFAARASVQSAEARCTIPSFPPPMMKAMGVLPRKFHGDNVNTDDYPLLHVAESVTWSNVMPVPTLHRPTIRVRLRGKFLSAVSKSVGTFVTKETKIYDALTDSLICSIRSTTLILGLISQHAIPYSNESHITMHNFSSFQDHELLFEMDQVLTSQIALFYRLTSGDTNQMHVLPGGAPFEDRDSSKESRPILHGLCTLGIASRMIMQHVARQNDDDELSVRHLEGTFTKPIFVSDVITVQAWRVSDRVAGSIDICFVVRHKMTGDVVLDKGLIRLTSCVAERSRL